MRLKTCPHRLTDRQKSTLVPVTPRQSYRAQSHLHCKQESDRGVSYLFGAAIIEKFLDKYDLDLIARGHQVHLGSFFSRSFLSISLSLSLSFFLSFFLSVSLSFFLPFYPVSFCLAFSYLFRSFLFHTAISSSRSPTIDKHIPLYFLLKASIYQDRLIDSGNAFLLRLLLFGD